MHEQREQSRHEHVLVHRHWRDMGPGERTVVVGMSAVQAALTLLAWADLASRPPALVRGPKPVWAAVIAVNVVGPVVYLKKGRTFPRVP